MWLRPWMGYSYPGSKKTGKDIPTLFHEADLDRYRGLSQDLVRQNPHAKGLLRNLVNYIVGAGPKIKIAAKKNLPDTDPDQPGQQVTDSVKKLVQAAQNVADDFAKRNKWSKRSREMCWREKRDGEFFLFFHFWKSGKTDVRFQEPEYIRQPPGATEQEGWSFGIQNRVYGDGTEDPERIVKIHAIDAHQYNRWNNLGRPTAGEQYQSLLPQEANKRLTATGRYLYPGEFIHSKNHDEDLNAKRGMPEFCFETYEGFRRASALQRNTSEGAAIRAAIGFIRQHKDATQEDVSDFQARESTNTVTNPVTGDLHKVQDVTGGQILDISDQMEFKEPPSRSGDSLDMQIVNGDLKGPVSAVCAPLYFTGETGDSSYAGLREASAPIIKYAETEQAHYAEVTVDIFSRVLQQAGKRGLGGLPSNILDYVEIQVEFPKVVHRDPLQRTQELIAQLQAQLVSQQTAMMELDREPEKELASMVDWKQKAASLQPQQGGAGAHFTKDGFADKRYHSQPPGGDQGGAPPGIPGNDQGKGTGEDGGQDASPVPESLTEQWDEAKHPRDHGKFAHGPGGLIPSRPNPDAPRFVKSKRPDPEPHKVIQAAKLLLKAANAAPEFAKATLEKAGFSPKVSKAALVICSIGDMADLIPGIPTASALVTLAAMAVKPAAPIEVIRDLIARVRGKGKLKEALESMDAATVEKLLFLLEQVHAN